MLTACSGDQITITCNHDQVGTTSTFWIISSPVNCSAIITHVQDSDIPECGSSTIMFQDINFVPTSAITELSSTAVVTANVNMSGSVIECRGGNKVGSVSVGNISLCIVGK